MNKFQVLSIFIIISSIMILIGLIVFRTVSYKSFYSSVNCTDIRIIQHSSNFIILCNYTLDNEHHKFGIICFDDTSFNCNQNYTEGGNAIVYVEINSLTIILSLSIVFLIIICIVSLVSFCAPHQSNYL